LAEYPFPHDASHVRVVDGTAKGRLDFFVGERAGIVARNLTDSLRNEEAVPESVQICDPSIEPDFLRITTTVSANKMKRLVQVTYEVYQKLQSLIGQIIWRICGKTIRMPFFKDI